MKLLILTFTWAMFVIYVAVLLRDAFLKRDLVFYLRISKLLLKLYHCCSALPRRKWFCSCVSKEVHGRR